MRSRCGRRTDRHVTTAQEKREDRRGEKCMKGNAKGFEPENKVEIGEARPCKVTYVNNRDSQLREEK